ncbi:hypothetical protein THMIRHAS_22920 [Thiosulfatimonas sediminis]|uniref:Cytochrome c domain-containing protein n=1 Tax=Thiosulfatimonas sediminis TaxID=2675054 RepID=A0A6F8PXS2_9GAMM|nr:hypothetical protein [Thiosulfatimonas sediminis]BBP46919.1 hypothetical protein THMIRHAS_22920 [Thiosulfatimonas sediminis]
MAYHRLSGYLSVIPLSILLSACGGGGDTTTAPATPASVSLSGTVPGTLIQAFCSDGSNPSVGSVPNGTTEHPFSLELPYQVDCRIVMITNEGTLDQVITPLTFNGDSIINMRTQFDLGYVPLAMSPDDIVDVNGDGVSDDPLNVTVQTVDGVAVYSLDYDPMDKDDNQIPDYYDDHDNDGVANYEDDDYQHDGDSDSDGIDDEYDRDDDNDGHDDADYSTVTNDIPLANYAVTRGRLLASQCFQCHGSNGRSVNGWDSIAGESYGEILEELNEYPTTHIMGAATIGYTQQEREDLATYLSTINESSSSSSSDSDSDDDDDDDDDDDRDDDDDDRDDD